MAGTNITLPDDLYKASRALGRNVSEVTRDALRLVIVNGAKPTEWRRLTEDNLAAEPPTVDQMAAADTWADRVVAHFQESDDIK